MHLNTLRVHAQNVGRKHFVSLAYQSDIAADIITDPSDGEEKLEKVAFRPVGFFHNVGGRDLYDVPIRFQIRSCSDNSLVFKVDTNLQALYIDSPAVMIAFPSRQGSNDIRKLHPGCYNAALISRQPDDGDRSNDTAYLNFTVVSHSLSDDISSVQLLSPVIRPSLPPEVPIHIIAKFKNVGLLPESQVDLSAIIRDKNTNIIYSNSQNESNWNPNETRNIIFADFNAPASGTYTLFIFSKLSNDQFTYNDTLIENFTIGNPCEVSVVSITSPVDGDIIAPGIGFAPAGLFRWEGSPGGQVDIPVSVQIYRCSDHQLVYHDNSIIPRSTISTGNTQFKFPSKGTSGNLADLAEGCYSLCMISGLQCDTDPLNDTVRSTFSIHLANDISADSIISPQSNSRVLVNTPIPLNCRFTNRGFKNQPKVKITAVITSGFGNVVYRDTIQCKNWNSEAVKDTSFRPFITADYGEYKCYIIALADSDQIRMNDTLSESFRATNKGDVAALEILNPRPNAIIPEGTIFQPTGLFQAFFGLQNFYNIPAHCQIISCTDNQIVFQSDSLIAELQLDSQATTFSFPIQQGNNNIQNLAVGCYKLELIISSSSDADHSDDTAYIEFSVFTHSEVQKILLNFESITLDQNFPNPFAASTSISYSLPENGRASIRILDITGRIIRTEITNGEAGEHKLTLDLHDLPNGVYIYELSYTHANGLISRLEKMMSILR